MPRPPPPRGFTLLETMVAFAIAVGAFVALFQAMSTGLRASVIADHTIEAWQRAQSRLAALSVAKPQPGDTGGDDGGGFSWSVSVRPLESQPDTRLRLFSVAVTIAWRLDGPERHVTLTTDRVAVGP